MPRLIACGTALAAGGLGLPLLVAWLGGRELPAELASSTQVLAGCLLAAAGLVCLIGWRLVGYARPAYVGCAFALLGVLTAPLPLVATLLPEHAARPGAPLARAAIALAGLTLAARAAHAPEVDSTLRVARLLGQGLAVALGLYTVLVVAQRAMPAAGHAAMGATVYALVGLCWLTIGAALTYRFLRGRAAAWVGLSMLLFGVQAGLRATSVVTVRPGIFALSALMMLSTGIAFIGSANGLLLVLRHQDRSLLRLSVDLRTTETLAAGERERHEEQLHDVRSALAAIRSANGTLHRYAGQLDERTRATLEAALTAELGRLEGLVAPHAVRPLVDFRLADVLTPLVVAERSRGGEILLSLGDLAVHGRPDDTATVVQNLLTNARSYAPGSVITVRAFPFGRRVRLHVEDSGPGIPEGERERVFDRGVRASTSAGTSGSGLGLYVSRRLMAEQHGTLSLWPGAAGGACFIVDLPAATALPATLSFGGEAALTGAAPCGSARHSRTAVIQL